MTLLNLTSNFDYWKENQTNFLPYTTLEVDLIEKYKEFFNLYAYGECDIYSRESKIFESEKELVDWVSKESGKITPYYLIKSKEYPQFIFYYYEQ
jgi:hypothetical protein